MSELLKRPVAVVGGAGFIGLHVCRELKSRGASVVVIDKFIHGERSRRAAEEIGAAVYDLDARDGAGMLSTLGGSDLAINLATVCVRASLADPTGVAADVNALGAVPAFACARAGVRRYVYVSSSEVYGEATEGPLHEGSVPRPMTTYGAAKLAGEHYANAARLMHGIEVVVVRPFNAYGVGSHIGGVAGEAIPRWIAQVACGESLTVHGDGAQTRDYSYVTDIARGIVDAALSTAMVCTGAVNLCSGVERSMLNVALDVASMVGPVALAHGAGMPHKSHDGPRPADLRRQVGCASRARTILGWEPRVSWGDGLDKTRADVLARVAAGENEVPERTWA